MHASTCKHVAGIGPTRRPTSGRAARLRLGGGQLGVGNGVNLPSPTLVAKLEVINFRIPAHSVFVRRD
jgi:hypothetical protein